MHAIKGSWAGQAFAVAASNDSGGRKSRIRRSKEERKAMVESFIKNCTILGVSEQISHREFLTEYQKSNDGNFPSLNLTHKEVGGSFYTVREIVREIIQENRVLAPPKVSLDEHDHSGFLEQHPLGSISMEPQIDLSVSDGIMSNENPITSEERFSSSSLQSNGSYPLELQNEEITNGVSKVADRDEVSDKTSKSCDASNLYEDTSMKEVLNYTEQLPQPKSHEFENEKIVTDVEVLEKNANSDSPLIANVDHKDNNDSAIESSQKFNGAASQKLSNEQYHNKNDPTVDKIKEFGERVYMESAVLKILDRGKHGAQDIETSQTIKPYMNSDVVVETFPLRPVPRSIRDVDGEAGKLHEAAGTLEDKAIQPDKRTFTQSSSDLVNEQSNEKLPESTVGLNGAYRGENMVLNLQNPSLECSISSSASQPSVLDIGDNADLESKDSLPDGTKTSNSSDLLTSKDSTAVGKNQHNSSLPKGNNPDEINLDTSEGASKNSTQPESNPLLALVKAFISSFFKFWTE